MEVPELYLTLWLFHSSCLHRYINNVLESNAKSPTSLSQFNIRHTLEYIVIGLVKGVEMVGVSWRGHVGTSSNYLWASGYMMLAGLAYAIRSRWLLTTIISTLIASMLVFVLLVYVIAKY